MSRQNATNFSGALQFPYANAAADLFKKEDVQVLAQAVDQHNHDGAGKGLALPNSSITSAMIVDRTIQAGDIAIGAIGSSELADNSINGASDIADLSIITHKMAGNSVTGHTSFFGSPAFSMTAVGVWTSTPITCTLACVGETGSFTRVDVCFTVGMSGAQGTYFYATIALDAATQGTLATVMSAFAGVSVAVHYTLIFEALAGTHTFTAQWYNNNAQTLSLSGAVQHSMVVTEFKK